MARSHSKTEVEDLRGVIKQLKAENLKLKRRLGTYEKRLHLTEDLEEREGEIAAYEEFEKKNEQPKGDNCAECGGKMVLIDLGIKKLLVCDNNRKHRWVVKK